MTDPRNCLSLQDDLYSDNRAQTPTQTISGEEDIPQQQPVPHTKQLDKDQLACLGHTADEQTNDTFEATAIKNTPPTQPVDQAMPKARPRAKRRAAPKLRPRRAIGARSQGNLVPRGHQVLRIGIQEPQVHPETPPIGARATPTLRTRLHPETPPIGARATPALRTRLHPETPPIGAPVIHNPVFRDPPLLINNDFFRQALADPETPQHFIPAVRLVHHNEFRERNGYPHTVHLRSGNWTLRPSHDAVAPLEYSCTSFWDPFAGRLRHHVGRHPDIQFRILQVAEPYKRFCKERFSFSENTCINN